MHLNLTPCLVACPQVFVTALLSTCSRWHLLDVQGRSCLKIFHLYTHVYSSLLRKVRNSMKMKKKRCRFYEKSNKCCGDKVDSVIWHIVYMFVACPCCLTLQYYWSVTLDSQKQRVYCDRSSLIFSGSRNSVVSFRLTANGGKRLAYCVGCSIWANLVNLRNCRILESFGLALFCVASVVWALRATVV